LSGPTGHGFSHAPRRRASGRYSAQGLFARFAAPKPNARPTIPRRGASSPGWWNAHPALESPGRPLEPRSRPQRRQRGCQESRSVTGGGVNEDAQRRPSWWRRVFSGDRHERQSSADAQADADAQAKANHRANYRATNPPEAAVRGAALSRGVDPQESECDALVEELRRGGYFETYPPSRPLAPRAVPTHRPGHRRSRGELNRPAPASLA
jgi:hypothetical protein